MKRIGLLGGMSWESSAEYYRLLNEETRARLGGLHSADCILRSVDFAEIEEMQDAGAWTDAGKRLAAEAATLTGAGAELLLLCTNTMHKVADAITSAVDTPLLHIADATADVIRSTGLSTIGLLGTAYTMEQDFYVGRLRARHGLNVLVPQAEDRRRIHDIIYDELCLGVIDDQSHGLFMSVMVDLVERGAEGIVLGCTEIGLLVGSGDATVPVFDTTRLHAQRAVELALNAKEAPARSSA
jgi:aspartate racemase